MNEFFNGTTGEHEATYAEKREVYDQILGTPTSQLDALAEEYSQSAMKMRQVRDKKMRDHFVHIRPSGAENLAKLAVAVIEDVKRERCGEIEFDLAGALGLGEEPRARILAVHDQDVPQAAL